MNKEKGCCADPDLVISSHPDVLFQGLSQSGKWVELDLDIECHWCANCHEVTYLD